MKQNCTVSLGSKRADPRHACASWRFLQQACTVAKMLQPLPRHQGAEMEKTMSVCEVQVHGMGKFVENSQQTMLPKEPGMS